MKKYTILLILIISTVGLKAQNINLDTLIRPIAEPHEEFSEYLVQLAWINNPENKILQSDIKIAEEEIKLAKWDWTEDIAASFNLNDRNWKKEQSFIPYTIPEDLRRVDLLESEALVEVATPGVTLFPRYNLTATVRLGTFLNNPKKTEIARQQLQIEEYELGQQKILVRKEVLRLYLGYVQRIEMLKIRTQGVEDVDAAYKYVANLFKIGEASFEQFNQASSGLLRAKEALLQTENEVKLIKLDLEMLIGMTLESARRYHNR